MDNLEIYNRLKDVPENAQRAIMGGKLKGKTDINPMWRIKALTETFGPCGIGWNYEIVKQWTEPGAQGETLAFCNILLFYKLEGEWSKGIPGTGGNALAQIEKGKLVSNDEAFKMALTDAISVAAKALGAAAGIYWGQDQTKYGKQGDTSPQPQVLKCTKCGRPLTGIIGKDGIKHTAAEAAQQMGGLCLSCYREAKNAPAQG